MTRKAMVVFGLLFGASIIAMAWLPTASLVSAVAVNLSTGILMTGLTVALVDRVVKRREAERQRRLKQTAFERLRIPLSDHVHFWIMVFKSALPSSPEKLPESFRALLAPEIIENLKEFNLESPAPVYPVVPWTQYLHHEIDSFRTAIDAVTDRYAFVLDLEDVRALETVANSPLLLRFPTMIATIIREPRRHPRAFAGMVEGNFAVSPLVRQHLEAVATLLELVNETVEPGSAVTVQQDWWGEKMAPAFGASRHSRQA
jgi:hypothetical protein